jgi:hypothetical protein
MLETVIPGAAAPTLAAGSKPRAAIMAAHAKVETPLSLPAAAALPR